MPVFWEESSEVPVKETQLEQSTAERETLCSVVRLTLFGFIWQTRPAGQKPGEMAQTYKARGEGVKNEGIPRRHWVQGDSLPCFPKRCAGMPVITDSHPTLSDSE